MATKFLPNPGDIVHEQAPHEIKQLDFHKDGTKKLVQRTPSDLAKACSENCAATAAGGGTAGIEVCINNCMQGYPPLVENVWVDDVLPDGDVINIRDVAANPPANGMTFVLRTKPGMWTKGVCLWREDNHEIADVIKSENGNTSSWTRVTLWDKNPFGKVRLVFWKAKTFGDMYPKYWVNPWELMSLRGNAFTFDWIKD